jgi:hypothetical protein
MQDTYNIEERKHMVMRNKDEGDIEKPVIETPGRRKCGEANNQ